MRIRMGTLLLCSRMLCGVRDIDEIKWLIQKQEEALGSNNGNRRDRKIKNNAAEKYDKRKDKMRRNTKWNRYFEGPEDKHTKQVWKVVIFGILHATSRMLTSTGQPKNNKYNWYQRQQWYPESLLQQYDSRSLLQNVIKDATDVQV